MDLIEDLGTDLAMAILVERRLHDRLDDHEAGSLIHRVRTALVKVSETVRQPGRPFLPQPLPERDPGNSN